MGDDDTTRIIRWPSNSSDKPTVVIGSQSNDDQDSDPHTRIYRPPSVSGSNDPTKNESELVVGWLVVVDGPGKGNSRALGYGVNTIGRANTERVPLDFGDPEITREKHALLTYDHKGKKFYLQHGGGANLTYVGETPVLQPVELKGREIIGIGQTKLSFIPFCGSDFSW